MVRPKLSFSSPDALLCLVRCSIEQHTLFSGCDIWTMHAHPLDDEFDDEPLRLMYLRIDHEYDGVPVSVSASFEKISAIPKCTLAQATAIVEGRA